MSQKLYTKQFGEIEVEKSWCEGALHIAKLTNGAYVHITGLPVQSKNEIKGVLSGSDLEEFLQWFDHRHDEEGKAVPRRIMFEADGTPVFEDGTPVESPSDLVQSLKPGPVLDAALLALAKKLEARKQVEKAAQSKAGAAAKAMAKTKSKAKAPAKAFGKQPTPPPVAAEPEGAKAITV